MYTKKNKGAKCPAPWGIETNYLIYYNYRTMKDLILIEPHEMPIFLDAARSRQTELKRAFYDLEQDKSDGDSLAFVLYFLFSGLTFDNKAELKKAIDKELIYLDEFIEKYRRQYKR